MPAHYNQHITVCYIYITSAHLNLICRGSEVEINRRSLNLCPQAWIVTSNVITSATRNNIAYWSLFMAFIVDY